MECLFENKTKYSEKLYSIFVKDYAKEYATSDRFFIFYNVLFFSLCSYIAFNEKEIGLGILIIIGILIFLFYKLIRPILKEKKNRSAEKISGSYVNHYKFYQNYFEIHNPEGDAKVSYLKVYKIIETKESYYIFLTREDAFIVSKLGFLKGNELDFTKFLKKKLMWKYKNRIKLFQNKK